MPASLSPLQVSLPVDPGGVAETTVRVHNGSDTVDRFVLDVLGEPALWAVFDPPEVALFPDTSGTTTLRFAPPRLPSTAPGPVPFAVRARSLEQDGETVAIEEGSLEVAAFYETAVEVMPRTSRGRLKGKHQLAFDNRGNTTVVGTVGAASPESMLAFGVHPRQLVAPPGTAAFAKVRVRPKDKSLRGVPQMHTFTLGVESEGAPPAVASAFMLQEPVLPRWLIPLAVALGVFAAAWFLLLAPQPTPTAQALSNSQAQTAARAANATAKAADAKAAAATKAAAAAQKTAAKTGAAAQKTAAKATAAAQKATAKAAAAQTQAKATAKQVAAQNGAPKSVPYSVRLVLDCPPHCRARLTVPKRRQLSLTDVVFGNPRGDTGLLRLARGKEALFVESLATFHDLPLHFGTPLVIDAKNPLVLSADCQNEPAAAGGRAAACTPAAYVTGTMATHPAPAKKARPGK